MKARLSSHLGAKMMKRKCRKCGKEFNAVLDVWYCSGQCERLAANPVAKFIRSKFSIHKPKKGKGSYDRRKVKADARATY